MTWDDLCVKAKALGHHVSLGDFGWFSVELTKETSLCFYRDGTIIMSSEGFYYSTNITVTKYRTPDQMWQIMEILK